MSRIMSVFEKLNLVEKVVVDSDEGINEIPLTDDDYKKIKNYLYNDADTPNKEPALSGSKPEATSHEPMDAPGMTTENENSNLSSNNDDNNLLSKYDRSVPVRDIYSYFGIESSNVNTIFMLGNFINALPESLPHDVKKKSVIEIVKASNSDLNTLIADGEKRLEALDKFENEFKQSTIADIEDYKAEIERLENIIKEYRLKIHNKENLLEEQHKIIRTEAAKIIGIIEFFEGESGDKDI